MYICCQTNHDGLQVQEQLAEAFCEKGLPEYLRSDNGSEFTAKKLREWLKRLEVTTSFIEPGSPLENGYIESFNGKMRDELLNGEMFDTMFEARTLIEQWRHEYNTVRPHSSLGYRPLVPVATDTKRISMLRKFTFSAVA